MQKNGIKKKHNVIKLKKLYDQNQFTLKKKNNQIMRKKKSDNKYIIQIVGL